MIVHDTKRLRVEFGVRAGWCRMYLTVDDEVTCFSATSLVDSLGALAHALAQIASGMQMAAALWGDEPGGVFIDLATVVPDHATVVFHQLGMPGWITPLSEPTPWLPVRGTAILGMRMPLMEFLYEFSEAFEAIRPATADGIPGWGHPFPVDSLAIIHDAIGKLHKKRR